MNTPETILVEQGVPVHSYVAAAIHINGTCLPEERYRANIEAILGTKVEQFESPMDAKLAYAYFTQNYLKRHDTDGPVCVEQLYLESVAEAKAKREASPWLYHDLEADAGVPQVDDNGVVKRKKGWKRDEAERLFKERKAEGSDMSRKAIIALFKEKLDMSDAGASTYYANCKKKLG